MFKYAEWHKQDGPIVRIGPDEVHINDPSYYNEVYASHPRRRDKSRVWYWMVGSGTFIDGSAFTTLDHYHHRLRRAGVAPYFSKKMVQDLEPKIKSKVLKLKKRLLEAGEEGQVVNLHAATSALTLDVISDYSFGTPYGALDRPDMGQPWIEFFQIGVRIHAFARTFPTFVRTMLVLPKWLTPQNKSWKDFESSTDQMLRPAYDEAVAMRNSPESQSKENHRTVIHAMIQDEALPEPEKAYERIEADASNLIGAGTETTGRTLVVTLFRILENKSIYDKLLSELRTVMPTPDSDLPFLPTLENLPYLTAVIHEGMRSAHGVAGRLVRIAPDEDLQYKQYRIPRGTTFSQSNYLVHTHPEYFPDPHSFVPDRFLGADGERAKKYLVPFGKGNRSCSGMNLAYSEQYLTLACVVSCLNWELFETTAKDVEIVEEHFLGCMPRDSKGIRVKVHGEL